MVAPSTARASRCPCHAPPHPVTPCHAQAGRDGSKPDYSLSRPDPGTAHQIPCSARIRFSRTCKKLRISRIAFPVDGRCAGPRPPRNRWPRGVWRRRPGSAPGDDPNPTSSAPAHSGQGSEFMVRWRARRGAGGRGARRRRPMRRLIGRERRRRYRDSCGRLWSRPRRSVSRSAPADMRSGAPSARFAGQPPQQWWMRR